MLRWRVLIALKEGVRLTHLVPAMAWAAFKIHEVYAPHDVVITSADDYDHGQKGVPDEVDPKTLHGKGKAMDFRTRHLPLERKVRLVQDVKAKLGADYDVLLEGVGTANEHLHVEWQPFGGI